MLQLLRQNLICCVYTVVLALCMGSITPMLTHLVMNARAGSQLEPTDICSMGQVPDTASAQDEHPAQPHAPSRQHCPCCLSFGGGTPALPGPLPAGVIAAPSFLHLITQVATVNPVSSQPGRDARPRAPPASA
jgi:hypothetical protein